MTSFGTWRVRALIRRRRSRTVPASVVLIMIVGGGRRRSLKAACQAPFLRKSDSRAQLCVTIGMSASALLSFWALSRGHPRACTSFVYGLHAHIRESSPTFVGSLSTTGTPTGDSIGRSAQSSLSSSRACWSSGEQVWRFPVRPGGTRPEDGVAF